jgi:hypothetical protein
MPLPITTSFRFISGVFPKAQKSRAIPVKTLLVLTQTRGVALAKAESVPVFAFWEKAGISVG